MELDFSMILSEPGTKILHEGRIFEVTQWMGDSFRDNGVSVWVVEAPKYLRKTGKLMKNESKAIGE